MSATNTYKYFVKVMRADNEIGIFIGDGTNMNKFDTIQTDGDPDLTYDKEITHLLQPFIKNYVRFDLINGKLAQDANAPNWCRFNYTIVKRTYDSSLNLIAENDVITPFNPPGSIIRPGLYMSNTYTIVKENDFFVSTSSKIKNMQSSFLQKISTWFKQL